MIVTSFHIPVLDNEGAAFDGEIWAWFQTEMVTRFAGWTLIGTVQGFWTNSEGRVFREEVYRYTVAVDDPETVRAVLREARHRFRQEAMYLEVGGTAELIE